MSPVKADKGIYRLASQIQAVKNKWYFGFICKECGEKIFSLEDISDGKNKAPIIGDGQFSVPCASCGTDELIYGTSDLMSFQAEKDGPSGTAFPRREPSNRPRQPVETRYPKIKPTFGPRFLEDRPECAIIIARCISLWSYIENASALLLASILKINSEPALAVFFAIQNSKDQDRILEAAAGAALNLDDYQLFCALMNLKKSYGKERNSLAHGLYGGSMLVKEGILWIEQKHSTAHTAKVWSSDFADMDQSQIRSETFVYEPADLETVANKLEWLQQMLGSFRGYISSDNDEWRAKRYKELCAEPQIAFELSKNKEKAR